MKKKKKIKEKNKIKEIPKKKYVGIIGYLLKIIDEKESRQSRILGWILNMIIVTSMFSGLGYFYKKYQDRKKIEQQIEIADNYFTTEQYEKAYSEYLYILKSFSQQEHNELYFNIVESIGKILSYQGMNSDKLEESIIFFETALLKYKYQSEEYNQLLLQIISAKFQLFEINPSVKELNSINKLLENISTKNKIILGLKFYIKQRYFMSKFSLLNRNELLDSTQVYINRAISIFNKETSKSIYMSLQNDLANLKIEKFHLYNFEEELSKAKEIYAYNLNNLSLETNRTDYAMSLFGLAHSNFHLFELNEDINLLYKAHEQIINSYNLYDPEKQPILYYSALSEYASIIKDIGMVEKDESRILESIEIYKKIFDFYKPNYFELKYYSTKVNLADTYFSLYELSNNLIYLKEVVSTLEDIKYYFKFESNPKINSNIIGSLGAAYKLLANHENKKTYLDKSNRLLTLPKRSSIQYEITDDEIIYLGETLSAYNEIAFLRSKDSSNLKIGNLYKLMADRNMTAKERKSIYNMFIQFQSVNEEAIKYYN